jgi:hypothetical protein
VPARWGWRRAAVEAKKAGWTVNHNRIHRLWIAEGFRVPYRKKKRPLAAALAEHQQHVQVEVQVGHLGAHQLGAARPHVDQQQDQRGVAAVLEALAGAGGQQPAQPILGHNRDRLLRDDRRAQPGHRAGGELAFFFQPGVQDAQDLVVGRRGGGGAAGEQVAQERLEVGALASGSSVPRACRNASAWWAVIR